MTALLTIFATLLLLAVVTYAGALYWYHVVRPAPARRRPFVSVESRSRSPRINQDAAGAHSGRVVLG